MSDHEPFSPINLAQDHYSSPATGLSTEKGDSWLTVQQKINAGFKHVYALFHGGIEHMVEAIDSKARDEIAELRETVTGLQMKLEAVLDNKTVEPPALYSGGEPQADDPTVEVPAVKSTGEIDPASFKAPGAGSE